MKVGAMQKKLNSLNLVCENERMCHQSSFLSFTAVWR